MLTQFYKKEEN